MNMDFFKDRFCAGSYKLVTFDQFLDLPAGTVYNEYRMTHHDGAHGPLSVKHETITLEFEEEGHDRTFGYTEFENMGHTGSEPEPVSGLVSDHYFGPITDNNHIDGVPDVLFAIWDQTAIKNVINILTAALPANVPSFKPED